MNERNNIINKEKKASINGINPDQGISVWFKSEKKELIHELIKKYLNLDSLIGKEAKKAISSLMKQLEQKKQYRLYNPEEKIIIDQKGREYIPFNDPDFHGALKLYNIGKYEYGGLIYAVDVQGLFYCGLTEKRIEKRFEEHIINALRGYYKSNGDINQPGYHKFYEAICNVLLNIGYDLIETYKKISTLSALQRYNERRKFLHQIEHNIKPYIRPCIIELHYSSIKLGSREIYYIKNFPLKSLFEQGLIIKDFNNEYPEYLDLRKKGLNTTSGGQTGTNFPLPLYDIAIMIALGLSAPKMLKDLKEFYNIKDVKIRTLRHKITEIFGGSYKAQEMFLKPIIEHLDSIEGISRHEIYLTFKDAELLNDGWFYEWSYGEEYLKTDIEKIYKLFNIDTRASWEEIMQYLDKTEKNFVGIPEYQWKEWFISNKMLRSYSGSNQKSIAEILSIGKTKIQTIVKRIVKNNGCNSLSELKYKLQRQKVIEILKFGAIIDIIDENGRLTKIELEKEDFHLLICKHVFNFDNWKAANPKNYMVNNLFSGMNLNKIWNTFSNKFQDLE
ncbi:MAG: hypothetical protein EU529_13710 [Promethearchaeota archaeon]|nr:MAG: hypothetical protein EU529_13710 [Candidatus Lokiarchaeota archaeon]